MAPKTSLSSKKRGRPRKEPEHRQMVTSVPRFLPSMTLPPFIEQHAWRPFVQRQGVLQSCRNVVISQISALPWQIVPKDSSKTDELADLIEYHVDILNHASGEDFDTWLDRGLQDLLTLPFGMASELGWYRDGTLAWIDNLDGALCYPTFNRDYPVQQMLPGSTNNIIYPKENVSRSYLSPRPELEMRGWGMAPPQAVFTSVRLLLQGDQYYWSFVSDTPEAGILDLMDMEEESAKEWLADYVAMLSGVDPYKMGILYEHEKAANFIPFQRPPSEIMMDKTMLWYATLVCNGYGVTLSEIGLGDSQTMAGSIRDDRRSQRTGRGAVIDKIETHINKFLPDEIQFIIENRDDEALTNLGRARSTSFTAFRQLLEMGVTDRESVLAQSKADGLVDAFVQLGEDPMLKMQRQMEMQGEIEAERFRRDERNDDLRRPESQGGLSPVKQTVEKSLAALLPIFRACAAQYGPNEVLDLGGVLKSFIMAPQEQTDDSAAAEAGDIQAFVQRSRTDVDDDFALALTADVLSAPWARRSILRASHPQLLRGSTAYYRLTKMLEGAYS